MGQGTWERVPFLGFGVLMRDQVPLPAAEEVRLRVTEEAEEKYKHVEVLVRGTFFANCLSYSLT